MDGILLINKPKGVTSRDVVNKISRILNTKKVGHIGTLDPLATGVLVLCINRATKLVELLIDEDKEYIAEVILGIETDTLDIDGKVIRQVNVKEIDNDKIKEALNNFKGTIKQEVPLYSSVKLKGKRLYKYARENKKVTPPTRKVNIKELELIEGITEGDKEVKFKIRCFVSKGTYIRSLVRDIGNYLGYPATMSNLIRTQIGDFKIEDTYSIDDVETNNYKLISMLEALSNYPIKEVDQNLEKKISNGMPIESFFNEDIAVITNNHNELIAIYKQDEIKKGMVKPLKIIKTLDFS
ncbi:MAG: tRNA pseudouridine(55) synthase TruB [Bacilli bacterium]|nr:tRNA pseudouridine(55) synthase TruB [Bacilli bacterium]